MNAFDFLPQVINHQFFREFFDNLSHLKGTQISKGDKKIKLIIKLI